jgi:hypothetical protein
VGRQVWSGLFGAPPCHGNLLTSRGRGSDGLSLENGGMKQDDVGVSGLGTR